MDEPRVPLYERLPEIYRVRDEEQEPRGQLRAYLSHVERMFGAIHANIEALYDDLFIETSADWVVPYIGDLLGASPLTGDPHTLRADVADTIALRRRKGTLASIERLTFDLTAWGVHCVELRENMLWNQHLNHQRPDAGGEAPLALPTVTRFTPARGGVVTLRDPALLSTLGTPFDPFAHVADLRPPALGAVRYNLPNLAIFLWRLSAQRVPFGRPVPRGTPAVQSDPDAPPDQAKFAARFDVDPLGRPVQLFNTYQFDPDRQPPVITELDATPGPIPAARLTQRSEAGRPEAYLAVDTYDPSNPALDPANLADVGLQLHVPDPTFAGLTWPVPDPTAWSLRGANLCAWEVGVTPPPRAREILVDPAIGRLVIGVAAQDEANALRDDLLVTYTYGTVGPVGAHPISRQDPPAGTARVPVHPGELAQALGDAVQTGGSVAIELQDSLIYDLDLNDVAGHTTEDGSANLALAHPLIVRAASGQRPILRLARPLRAGPEQAGQVAGLTLRLEGLFVTRGEGFPAGQPLIARAVLEALEVVDCTLDPGGWARLDGTREPVLPSLGLGDAGDVTPRIVLQHTVSGPLLIDKGYALNLAETILDAGAGVDEDATDRIALSDGADPALGFGPPTELEALTVFGRVRVESINGRGGIFVHRLEVLDNQRGCLRYSYFSGEGDRLPQNLGCVSGPGARLSFTSSIFGSPAYAQLAFGSDFRIRERGPDDDAMGATGPLFEAHKWRNLQIRFREFMPVGVRPLLIPVT